MSNLSKDHTSNRVQVPPGGHSNNIFGMTEFEQSAANKKKQSESNIFGSKNDNADPAPVKQTRNMGNNIFGTDPVETHHRAETLAGQYKQTQMKSNIFGPDEPTATRHVSDKNKSNIFGPDEPTTTRHVSDKNKSNIFGPDEPTSTRHFSDKNKSNIFGIGDNDQNKRQTGIRQGVRVGYNPINGESYSIKDNVNEKQPDSTVKAPEEENVNAQAAKTENGNAQAAPAHTTENGSTQAASTNTAENGSAKAAPTKPTDNAPKPDNAQQNVHTSVRVFQPPGGKSHGPLW